MSERRKTIAASAVDPDQSTDPVVDQNDDEPNFQAFMDLVKESKQLLEDIKDIENDRELKGGDADIASHVLSSDYMSGSPNKKGKKGANLESEIAAANNDVSQNMRISKDDTMMLETIKESPDGKNAFDINIDDVEMDDDDVEYVKFKERKQTLTKKMKEMAQIKYPSNEKKQKELVNQVSDALNSEEGTLIKIRKTIKARKTIKMQKDSSMTDGADVRRSTEYQVKE